MVQIQFQIMNLNDNAAKENWVEEQILGRGTLEEENIDD